jgi:hypothetical protein
MAENSMSNLTESKTKKLELIEEFKSGELVTELTKDYGVGRVIEFIRRRKRADIRTLADEDNIKRLWKTTEFDAMYGVSRACFPLI